MGDPKILEPLVDKALEKLGVGDFTIIEQDLESMELVFNVKVSVSVEPKEAE